MKLALTVYAPPYSSQAAYSAYRFSRAALARGHSIERIFFYHDGVYNASALAVLPQDEFDLCEAWCQLQREHQLDLSVCVAAALRRGVMDAAEAARHDREAYNLPPEFSLAGLGQLVDAAVTCDRLITFGRRS